ncbi:MAG: hypothetical protein Q8O89_00125 [Nanoarchaeota archaeon]|nr:hypothetical protein [Nanoarchaeota archaeon]
MDLAEKLRKKGWPEEEIEKTVMILQSDEGQKKQTAYRQSLSPILYWSALILTMVGNLVVSVVMVPFLVILQGIELYFIIAILGGAFGLLFNLIINDIEHMDTEHHIVAGAFIPAIAAINVFIIVKLSNLLTDILKISFKQNAVIIAFIYITSFMAPYLIFKFSSKE